CALPIWCHDADYAEGELLRERPAVVHPAPPASAVDSRAGPDDDHLEVVVGRRPASAHGFLAGGAAERSGDLDATRDASRRREELVAAHPVGPRRSLRTGRALGAGRAGRTGGARRSLRAGRTGGA